MALALMLWVADNQAIAITLRAPPPPLCTRPMPWPLAVFRYCS